MPEANPISAVLTLIALGLAIRVALRLFYGVRGSTTADPVHLTLSVVAWVFLGLGLTVVFVFFTLGAFVPLVIATQASLELAAASRSRQREAALALVTGACERGTPVAPRLRENLGRFGGRIARQVAACADALDDGEPIEQAIARYPAAFPDAAQACAALSEGSGPPLPVLVRAVSGDGRTGARTARLIRRFGYVAWVGAVMLFVVTFVFSTIVPEYEMIFSEFGIALPPISRAVFGLSNASWLQLAAFVLGGLLSLAVIGAFLSACAGLLFDVRLHGRLVDRLSFGSHRARVLRLLAVVTKQRASLAEALNRLIGDKPRYPSRYVVRRLKTAANELSCGADWRAALRKGGFLDASDEALLLAAEGAGNTPWALRSIADRRQARSEWRWESRQQAAFTLLTLGLGLLVAWFAVAMFLPLVKMIESLA